MPRQRHRASRAARWRSGPRTASRAGACDHPAEGRLAAHRRAQAVRRRVDRDQAHRGPRADRSTPRHVRSLAILNESLRYLSDLEPASFIGNAADRAARSRIGLRRDRGLGSGQPLQDRPPRPSRRASCFRRARASPTRSTASSRGSPRASGPTAAADGRGASRAPSRLPCSVDGKPVWSSGLLRSGQPPESVDVGGLSGGKELAIEVEFADSFDAGARAVFGNAMLIR